MNGQCERCGSKRQWRHEAKLVCMACGHMQQVRTLERRPARWIQRAA